jgi:hypothetical protein
MSCQKHVSQDAIDWRYFIGGDHQEADGRSTFVERTSQRFSGISEKSRRSSSDSGAITQLSPRRRGEIRLADWM